MEHQGLKDYIKKPEKTLNGDGRILVRCSGTEQLIRVMVEATDIRICNEITDKIVNYINYISY